MITVITSSRYKINRRKIKAVVQKTLLDRGLSDRDVLNVVFVGKNKMRQLTQRYKHEENALPVLSFPYHGEKMDDESMLGEVIICYPLTILLAAERNKRVEDVIDQLVEHGVNNLINSS